jgi:hypothetical protein
VLDGEEVGLALQSRDLFSQLLGPGFERAVAFAEPLGANDTVEIEFVRLVHGTANLCFFDLEGAKKRTFLP